MYLNIYSDSPEFTDREGYLKCSPHGPQLVSIKNLSSVKAFLSKCPRKNQKEDKTKVTTNIDICEQSLLHAIGPTSMTGNKTIKVMDNKGATLIVVEGTLSMLSDYDDLKVSVRIRKDNKVKKVLKKPYLIPNVMDAMKGKGNTSFQQRFHVIEPANIFRHNKTVCNEVHDVESFDDYVQQGDNFMIPTTCFDLKCYPRGLIFCFREVDDALEMKIKEEHVLPNSMQHNEIFEKYGGVVVSEWFQHNNFLKVPMEAVEIMQTVYGQKGFGDRSCSKCLGTNIYNGPRHTEATVGNPL